jgi:hypothetical protein
VEQYLTHHQIIRIQHRVEGEVSLNELSSYRAIELSTVPAAYLPLVAEG